MAEPTPINILRGHKSQIHAAAFVRRNERLATGDADGYVMLWDLAIMRPKAVWQAHQGAILAIRGWGSDKIITHGRDHRLVVWQLRLEDEQNLAAVSPLEHTGDAPPQPWMLHVLEVNTMNFCAFAGCPNTPGANTALTDDGSASILVAVPNTLLAESIDIFELPSQKRIHTVKPGEKHGMAMTLAILYKERHLVLIAGFENGMCSVFVLRPNSREWITTYRSQSHSQPVLSLDADVQGDYFISSAADALLGKHPIPTSLQTVISEPMAAAEKAHATEHPNPTPATTAATTGVGALFAGQTGAAKTADTHETLGTKAWEHPLKVANTKHAGQQNLTIRSDSRIFATAGWDAKVRVYATRSLKELAVLKWHQVGVYAAAFAHIKPDAEEAATADGGRQLQDAAREGSESASDDALVLQSEGGPVSTRAMTTVKNRRLHHAKHTHWVAAGAKDGKLSLWDIY
ncbi:WD40 repeat-like-containing domain protein [Cordyceps fumosorosea ARSEF 2679]|uniref:ASTRA-associated protein 1 n=1 Tax=Cordyceps fumosorosea (strain ARSEF 2679) TaxID=1081104 RepID=A0A167WH14_CORFA|nr:WD40 repeat-like-containing domain protein [Cordyceps fumosorosea ARSEF 2679]OAA63777.1 WD40 repeat-like-containing domain protein [Cordyceps fumosorosea ARSEF 2679]